VNLRAIREELGDVLGELNAEFHVYVYNVIPVAAEFPAAIVVWPEEIRYDRTLKGAAELDLTVTIVYDASDFVEAQKNIDEAMSTPGYPRKIVDHEGVAWRHVEVLSAGNVRSVVVGPNEGLGFDFSLRFMSRN
jgi:hypothetical protein